ncbi:uncharacterized protein LOC105169544 [Sesamum indicum]|uniref:Uncharacterized protein LOC105169544 n=1 Tax=Sesamum indicum TaxID=4182 RepID=A0A6I9TTQ1_SESIN|nr:uncharacterized protein LOC105169544 [Sesamum indicum]
MEGSIANELYSEVLQSSSVKLDGGSNAVEANDNSYENDPGDLWYDDGSSCEDSVEKLNRASDMDREWQRRRDQFHTLGYRDGLIAGKEAAAQEGFNIGFKDSVFIGYSWGRVRGMTSAMACLPSELREKLVEREEARNKFKCLHESVQSLSTTDALKLFYEDQKRKSSNQEEAEPSSTTIELDLQNPDVSVLKTYSEQLHSLLSEAPLFEETFKIN